MKFFQALLLTFITQSTALAFDPPIKFGKVPKEEVKMTQYEHDPDADAVVLCDYGITDIRYDKVAEDWRTTYTRICRIKIFSTNGFDWATHKVKLYDYNGTDESVSGIKGYTYNLENDKVVKTKLSKDNIFDEDVNKYYNATKFTMPNVKEGSVIEFRYKIHSELYYRIRPWEFQKPIPVKWSEFSVYIPEYLQFIHLSQGFEPYVINEHKQRTEIISSRLTYLEDTYHWAAQNLPGLKGEKYISSPKNFYQKIDFQLSGFKDSYNAYHDYMGSWEKVNEQLLKDDDFGRHLKTRNFYSDVVEKIKSEHEDPRARAEAIYKHVSERMKWNEERSKYLYSNIKKAYQEKAGNAAAINFIMISMMKDAGISAKPVITSTIDNGYINPVYPILDKYNYLIAEINIEGEQYLVDATEENLPLGILPYRALNKRGRRIEEGPGDWVAIQPKMGNNVKIYAVMDLDKNGHMSGNLELKKSGYNGLDSYNKLLKDGEQSYIEEAKKERANWQVSSLALEKEENNPMVLSEKYDFSLSKGVMHAGNIIYINPFIAPMQIKENPFKQETRKLPIELIFPYAFDYIMVLNLPKGYTADEIPTGMRIGLPDGAGTYVFSATQVGNKIQLISKFNISKTTFTSEEYPYLKSFFDKVFTKLDEQIVIKKAAQEGSNKALLNDKSDNN